MILVIDPRQSGLSGDMLISTLTDFFKCHQFTNSLLQNICLSAKNLFSLDCSYKVEKTVLNHFEGSKLVFNVEKDFSHLSVQDFINNWEKLVTTIDINKKIVEKSFQVLNKIIEVEQQVHGNQSKSLHDIHFHELNSIDTIIDITVTIAILERENFPVLYGLPTAIGTGTITFSHGTFQQPAPAVAKLLEKTGYPIVSRELDFELTTPTGLALLTTIIDLDNVSYSLPTGKIGSYGIGFGQKQPKGTLNFIRLWSFSEVANNERSKIFENDSMLILETHVDDASGELMGNVIETYSGMNGVMDVSIYPLIMKKNRPGHCIRLLVDPVALDLDSLSVKLMKDTGSLGVRHYPVSRHKSVRMIQEQMITYGEENFKVRVKISKVGDEIIAIKPEYDDIKTISIKTNKSFKEIHDAVMNQINKQ